MRQRDSLEREPAPASAVPAEVIWGEVTGGRFQVVDWYDRDGRRYVVTRRATGTTTQGLTERQRLALARRSAGAALKVVAFELGVSLSTVARDIERAMAHLGLKSQGDLAAVLGHASV